MFLQKEMAHSNRVLKENLSFGPFIKVWSEFRKSNMGYCSASGLTTAGSMRPENIRGGSHYQKLGEYTYGDSHGLQLEESSEIPVIRQKGSQGKNTLFLFLPPFYFLQVSPIGQTGSQRTREPAEAVYRSQPAQAQSRMTQGYGI